jgi:hypothetical protein
MPDRSAKRRHGKAHAGQTAQSPRRSRVWRGNLDRMARNSLINLEEMSEKDVERMKAAFAALADMETTSTKRFARYRSSGSSHGTRPALNRGGSLWG